MSETASAQPLTLFQSPVMAALERLLGRLAHRVAGPQSQFGSRNLNFVERLLSRRLDTLGVRSDASSQIAPRSVEPQRWLLPRTWVPTPDELSTEGTSPSSQVAVATGAAQRRPAVVAPLPSRPQTAPSLPLPLPPLEPTAAPQSAVATKAAAVPGQAAPPLPPIARVTPPASLPLPDTRRDETAPQAARAVAPSVEPVLAPVGVSAVAPSAVPSIAPSVQSAEPTAPVAASVAPVVLDSAVAVPSVVPSSQQPQTTAVAPQMVQPIAPQMVQPVALQTGQPVAPIQAARPTVTSDVAPAVASAPAPSTVVTSAPTPIAASAPPSISRSAQALIDPSRARSAPEAITAAPVERRVRDWLAQFSVALPSPVASVQAPSNLAPPRYSALARAFAHLGFADNQLVRSPAQRLAAAELVASAPVSERASVAAMPMVATPDLVAPSKQRTISAVAASAPASAAPSAAPSRLPFVPPAMAPAATVTPSISATPAGLSAVAMSPALAQILPTLDAPIAAAAAVAPAVASASPIASALPIIESVPSIAPSSRALPFAAPSRFESAAASRIDLGILASPIFPSLQAAAMAPAPERQPSATAAPSPSTWSLPGALAAQVDRFAVSRRAHGPAAASVEGTPELREWATAPGVPVALSRALQREASYTPARWQPVAATLPYLPVPTPSMERETATTARDPRSLGATPSRIAAPLVTAPPFFAAQQAAAPLVAAPTPPSFVVPQAEVSSSRLALPSPVAALPVARAETLPFVAAPSAAQPWREAGGTAMLAELFAAGVGFGSGAVATLAQTYSAGRSGSLISSWLAPLIRELAAPSPSVGEAALPRSQTGLPLSHWDAPPVAGAPAALRTPSPIGQLAAASPLTGRFEASASRELEAPPSTPSPRFAQTAQGMVYVPSPTAARPSSPRPLIGASFSHPGAMGLLTERLASAQAPRTAGSSALSSSELAPWMQAPGISTGLVKTLAREPGFTPERWQDLSSSLPYLPAPQRVETSASASSTALLPRVTPSLPQAVAPQLAPSRGVAPSPSSQSAASSSSFASTIEELRPWLLPGGTAALAELFAAGIGIGSGAAGWLAEPVAERKASLVADWLRPFLRPQEAVPASAASPRRLPTAESPAVALSYVPWSGPRALAQEAAPRSAEAARTVDVAARSPRSDREAIRPELAAERSQPGLAGGLSAFAEQFAAVHGLSGLAPRGDEGRWVPVSGGMVFVPRQEEPRRSEGEPAIALAKPQLAPPPSFSTTGGMGLRSELFATQQVARSAPPSLRELDQASQAVSELPQRSGFSSGGGLFYIGPSALPSQAAQTTPSAQIAQMAQAAAALLGMPPAPGLASSSSLLGTAAPARGASSRLSILDLAQAGLLTPPSANAVEASREAGFPFSFLPAPQAPPVKGAPSIGAAAPSLASLSTRGDETVTRRMWSGGLPVLPTDAPPSVRGAQTAAAAAMGQPAAQATSAHPVAADLASRYVAPMLTSFPRPLEMANQRLGTSPEAPAPRMLSSQPMTDVSERLQRLLSILPVDWVPPPSVLAALEASGVAGMPFWQRMPSATAKAQPVADASMAAIPKASVPMPLPIRGEPIEQRAADSLADDEEQSAPPPPPPTKRPSMTLVEGDGSPQRRRPGGAYGPSAAPVPSSVTRTPEIAMISRALQASGASSEQVEASVRLVEAIRTHATSQPSKSDDRLNLGDLTLIALSMGENRMAASGTGAMAAQTRIGSVEKALHMHPSEHPRTRQEDTDLMKKVDSLSKQVMKMVDRLKKDEDIRGSHNM